MRTTSIVAALVVLTAGLSPAVVTAQQTSSPDSVKVSAVAPAYDRPVNPDEYLIRPGERLQVTFIKSSLPGVTLTVTAEGRIVDPTLGLFMVSGKTLTEVRKQLLPALSKQYSASEIDVSVGSAYPVSVLVSGAVKAPGYYQGWTSGRVSDILAAAGGLNKDASTRRIQFVGGPETIVVDMDRATYLGIDTLNPPLYAGYRLLVPQKSRQRVQVVGEVASPREIELLSDDNVGMLIQMAGGVRDGVEKPIVEILGRPTPVQLSDAVSAGDVIVVRSDRSAEPKTVLVLGAVAAPGRFPFDGGMTLGQGIERAGGVTSDANSGRIAIFRRAEPDEWGRVDEARYAIEGAGMTTDLMNTPLRAGDSVLVPRLQGYVKVSGQVSHPGLIPYIPNKDAAYYIDACGGFIAGADRTAIDVVNRVSHNVTRTSPAGKVYDGDEIVAVPQETAP